MRPLLLAGVLLLSTLPAHAENVRVRCGQFTGMDYCVTDTLYEDTILILGPEGGERINVDCARGGWKANGPNSKEFVENIINHYCSNSN